MGNLFNPGHVRTRRMSLKFATQTGAMVKLGLVALQEIRERGRAMTNK